MSRRDREVAEVAEGTGFTGGTETRRRTEKTNPLATKNTKTPKPVDWPPKAACRDIRQRKYKPLTDGQCGLYLRCLMSRQSACFARRPIDRSSVRLLFFVPPVKTVISRRLCALDERSLVG